MVLTKIVFAAGVVVTDGVVRIVMAVGLVTVPAFLCDRAAPALGRVRRVGRMRSSGSRR